ncbi:MAG TPA: type II toxin-antitoxin system HicA family toxin [Pyrinomonadaceae bacterium]|nr:type II toxin-antitoxin system HicA family toxin [Pyrinomonadaceae bacterium]
MNRKHRKIVDAVFTVPTLASIKFADLEKLLTSLGAEKMEGRGSRVAFVTASGNKWEAHRPHPGEEAKKYQIESVRDFVATLLESKNE